MNGRSPQVGEAIVIRHTKYRIVEIRDGPTYLLRRHPRRRARHSLLALATKYDEEAQCWRVTDGILSELKGGGEE